MARVCFTSIMIAREVSPDVNGTRLLRHDSHKQKRCGVLYLAIATTVHFGVVHVFWSSRRFCDNIVSWLSIWCTLSVRGAGFFVNRVRIAILSSG